MNHEPEPTRHGAGDGQPALAPDPERVARPSRRVGRWAVGGLLLAVIIAWGRLFFFDSEPPYDADLLPPPVPAVPEEENGWALVAESLVDFSAFSVDQWFFDQPESPVIDKGMLCFDFSRRSQWTGSAAAESARAFLRSLEPAFELADAVLARPHFVIPTEGVGSQDYSEAMALRSLALWLSFRIDTYLLQNRAIDARQDALQIIGLGATLQTAGNANRVHVLSGSSVERLGFSRLLEALDGRLESPDGLEEIASRLAELSVPEAHYELALRNDYWSTRNSMLEGSIPGSFKPNRTLHALAEFARMEIEQSRLPFPERDFSGWDAGKFASIRETLFGNSWSRFFFPDSDIAADVSTATTSGAFVRHAVRLAIASCRYRLREGALPPTLDLLVPDFLEALPADPFTGGPIRYDPERAILWSPGSDGIDRGGIVGDLLESDPEEPTIRIPAP